MLSKQTGLFLTKFFAAYYMRKCVFWLPGVAFAFGFHLSAVAQAQTYPTAGAGGGLAPMAAAKANTTITYRGQSFLMKRTPDNVLTGEATAYIVRLENQLSFCYAVLLADTLNPTCPPEREATIRAAIKYINLNRLNWDQKAYRQEFSFYLAEDKRRRRANSY